MLFSSCIRYSVLLLLLFAGWNGYTQSDKLQFKHLTIEQGLSHNTVSKVIQDKKGYLWFGTDDGLNRYDGYTFKVYKFDPADTTSLTQNEVSAIWEDAAGNLWVGTGGGGLSKVEFCYHPQEAIHTDSPYMGTQRSFY